MRKVKCFEYHKFGHYAGKYPNKKNGGKKTKLELASSIKTQMDEFAKKFQ
jgi:hypothetical protein